MTPPHFSYHRAFDRNVGWLTEWEQTALRAKRVAIAGMGGVGGIHLITLTRLGIGAFNIADFDSFDIVNFNRQAGANMQTVGRPKAEVMEEQAKAINPELDIRRFDQGIDDANLDDFLKDVDLFVDGFDFFVLGIRSRCFARCAELGIPACTAGPIGMGTGYMCFVPGGMTFEQYFRFEGQPEQEQYLRFLMGLVPKGLHRQYLVDPSRLDLAAKRGPSTAGSCALCAGVVSAMAVKLILRRPGVMAAPYHHHFDPYRNKYAISKLRWGNDGPVAKLKLAIARKLYAGMANKAAQPPAPPPPQTPIEEILNLARWAPSGDNVQPWRIARRGAEGLEIVLTAVKAGNPYDYRQGEANVLAGGMLLESLAIAATGWNRRMEWAYEGSAGDGAHRLGVRFIEDEAVPPDPLLAQLPLRSVDRRSYKRRPLRPAEKAALSAAVGDALVLDWHETAGQRMRIAGLGALATDIRLRAPEAFPVHQRIVDFQRLHSPDAIPAKAVGLSAATLKSMGWAMEKWSRMQMFNKLGATLSAALEMDRIPALNSAAFFTLRWRAAPPADGRTAALLEAGRAIQRFWLTATKLGLAMQPGLAIIAFAHYGETGARFTEDASLPPKAAKLAARFAQAFGEGTERFVFLGRIGEGQPRLPKVRSTRLAQAELAMTAV